ncbi:MAG: ribonuclease III [Clostridiales bacterium]|nr:ribonuclease III [Clostridiales bacterium]
MADFFGEIEKAIGYEFKNKELLKRAFTHGSYPDGKSYQNIGFLGDSILDFIVAKVLFECFDDHSEGYLSKLRAQIVSEKPLADAINRLGVSKYLFVGTGEKKQNISSLPSVESDLYEAIVGAIFLDSGIKEAEDFILRTLYGQINLSAKSQTTHDYKSKLNEYALKNSLVHRYEMISGEGPAHNPMFTFAVYINDIKMGEGKGKTKKEAQQNAAKAALYEIKNKKLFGKN